MKMRKILVGKRIKLLWLRILGWRVKDFSYKEKEKIVKLGKKIDFGEISIPQPNEGRCPTCGKKLCRQIVSQIFGSPGAPSMGEIYFKYLSCHCGYEYATAFFGEGFGDFGPLKFIPPQHTNVKKI